MHRVLISDPLSEEGIKPLREADDIEIIKETSMSHEELLEAIGSAEALIVRSQTQVTREVIEHAPHLKIIAAQASVSITSILMQRQTMVSLS